MGPTSFGGRRISTTLVLAVDRLLNLSRSRDNNRWRDTLLLISVLFSLTACAGIMARLEGDPERLKCIASNLKFTQLRLSLQQSNLTLGPLAASLDLVDTKLAACDMTRLRWSFAGATWYWW